MVLLRQLSAREAYLSHSVFVSTIKVIKIGAEMVEQIMLTQIRLFLKVQSDQGLFAVLFKSFKFLLAENSTCFDFSITTAHVQVV